jgi:ribosomal protein S15P/S13E
MHERRKLAAMINRRRRMLMYMRRKDFPAYCYAIRKLGLKDMYTETVR